MGDAGAASVTREITLRYYGVQVLIVDLAGVGVCARLREFMPPSLAAGGRGDADACYVVERSELA